MKLYAWQPRGHGEDSFFVCANSQEEALACVEAEIARRMAIDPDDYDCEYLSDKPHGWGTDYYVLTVLEPGQVISNDNS